MTPDEHAEAAEAFLAQAEKGGPAVYVASLERKAIAHAALSLRQEPKPAPRKRTTKKTTAPKEKSE